MNPLAQTLTLARQLYGARATTWFHGRWRGDLMARLQLREGRVDPYPIYRQLRDRGPILPTRYGNYATTTHALCNAVLRDRSFGVRPESGPGSDPADDEFEMSFLELNPPDHRRLRRIAAPAFSPRQMADYRPLIEKQVHHLLDAATQKGEFDLVRDFAAPLPIAVITQLLGIPDARTADFERYGRVIGSALDGVQSLPHARRLMAASRELEELFSDLFALRRREPGDDVISRLVAAEGDTIEAREMVPMCVLLLIAGFETTVNLIGNGTLALLDHPEQWARLRDDPELAPGAVDEVLRYDPPVQRTWRLALEDREVGGQPVGRGQVVLTLIGAANRDPEVFPDPDHFDIGRENASSHLAFSAGIHYCVGQPLAVEEGSIALAALAERLPRLRRVGRVRRRNGTTIRGPLSVPVHC